MDRDDEIYLEKQLKEYKKQVLNSVAKDCLKLFKEALNEAVYQSYTPTWYDRTFQLLEASTYKIENDILYIYINTDELTYHSWVNFQDTGKEVGSAVAYFVEQGHIGKSTDETSNQYTDYEPRYYLERAKNKIDLKYGLDVQIINDRPSMV